MGWLTSALFLGWSLGANDAANIFGTAVASRMVRFRTAAIITTIFVILGGVIVGPLGVERIGKLGAIDSISGAFTAALAAALTVMWMTRLNLPVSTTQAIVGSALSWSYFAGKSVAWAKLIPIVIAWVASPLLCAVASIVLYYLIAFILKHVKTHMLVLDAYLRYGLIAVGSYGAWALGGNNMGNVVGVFNGSGIFNDTVILGIPFSEARLLSVLGALGISVGVITYSYGVMITVGGDLVKLDSMTAFIAIASEALVLDIFGYLGIPVSSSQALVGAVLGVGLIRGGNTIKLKVLGRIVLGWIATPVIAAVVCLVALYVVKNVFEQEVVKEYGIAPKVSLQTSR
ncbi:MAG: inorganic phosphate transporter [SAR324 cluster bacterium]|nr:inorganic phosphate transporter [SAR324 cluster bacterium]